MMNNLAFFVLLMLCMVFHYVPVSWHEVMGIMLLLPFIYHMYSCRRWWLLLLRGRTAGSRLGLLSSLLNVLMLAAFVVVIASGALISSYVFRDAVPLAWRMNITLHQLHVSGCYWLLLLTAVHAGLHYEGLRRRLFGAAVQRREYALIGIVVLTGLAGSVYNQLGSRLMMKHVFYTEALQLPGVMYFLLMLGVFGMYFLAGWSLKKSWNGKA